MLNQTFLLSLAELQCNQTEPMFSSILALATTIIIILRIMFEVSIMQEAKTSPLCAIKTRIPTAA
jgi:hypothetical protein